MSMPPKDKAKHLIDKYTNLTDKCSCLEYMCICFRIGEYDAKRCALIAVDEILDTLWHTHKNEKNWRYYLEVKQEIENL